uniref:Ig-like domain-containing protein n=1 Tax=Astyanax mexicanus TaxID=7994 RepID=A0A3B1K8Y2_ASTMX
MPYPLKVLLTLETLQKPKPKLTVKPERTVFRGETVTLTCEIETREDTEWTYSWFKNNEEVQSDEQPNEYTFKATSGDSAAFTCRGTRTKHPITTEPSNPVSLSVSGEFLFKMKCNNKVQDLMQ